MSKLPTLPRLPRLSGQTEADLQTLVSVLNERFQDVAAQVNAISEGRVAGYYNAQTAQPTGGLYARGDFVHNKEPSEAGTAGSRYVVLGWKFTVDGTASAASSVEVRALTGN